MHQSLNAALTVCDKRTAQGVIAGTTIWGNEIDLLVHEQDQIRLGAQILPNSRAGAVANHGDAVSMRLDLTVHALRVNLGNRSSKLEAGAGVSNTLLISADV